jgi:PAS domain S-box-containing protein
MTANPYVNEREGWAPRALALIRGCQQALAQAKEIPDFFQQFCRVLAEEGSYPLVWVALAEEDELRTLRPLAQAGKAVGLVARFPKTWGAGAPEGDPILSAIRDGQPVLVKDLGSEAGGAAYTEVAQALDLNSCVAFPLSHQGRILGVLTLFSADPEVFTPLEQEILQHLTALAAYFLITGRLREELARVKNRLNIKEEMLDSSPYAIFVHDLEDRIICANQAASKILGLKKEELLHLALSDLVPPENARNWETRRQTLLSQKEAVFESVYRRQDGSTFPVEIHARVIQRQGRTLFLSIVLDISERKRIEGILQECEAKFQEVFEHLQVGVFRSRLSDGALLECNESLARMFGFDNKEEFLKEFAAREHWLDPATHLRMLENLRNGQLQNFEVKSHRRDGTVITLLCSARVSSDQQHLEGVATDITDLSQDKDSHKKAEEHYRTLMEQLLGRTLLSTVENQQLLREIQEEKELSGKLLSHCPTGVLGFDQEFRITLCNPALERLTGLSRRRLLGKNLFQVLPRLSEFKSKNSSLSALKGFLNPDRIQKLSPSGPEGFYAAFYCPLSGEPGEEEPGGLIFIHDLTAQKRAERALKEQEELVTALLAALKEGVAVLDGDLRILKANAALERLFPQAAPLKGKFCYAALHGAAEPCKDCPAFRTLATGQPVREVVPAWGPLGPDTQKVRVEFFPLKDRDTGETVGVILRLGELASEAREKAPPTVWEHQEGHLAALVENLPLVVGRLHPDGTVTFLKDKIQKLTGYPPEEFAPGGRPWQGIMLPEDQEPARKAFLQALGTDRSYVRQYRIKTKDGRVLWLQESGQITCDAQGRELYTDIVLQDITEHKQLEELRSQMEAQLRHAQRMDAIGTLAGGIAHDFNNILGVMLGYTEMALMSLKDKGNEDLKRRLQQVLKAGKRGKDLVSQILSFSRPASQERRPVHVSAIVKEALTMMRATLPSTIELKMKLEEDHDLIMADATQIHQVIINLCANAAHAMREKGGLLEIVTKAVDLDAKAAHRIHGLSPGPYLKLTVRDTGCGMDREVMEKIFDPFFTTKKMEEGTGMGLAVVHGIVKAHQGAITVQSQVGKGSEFSVYFPRVEGAVESRVTEAPLSGNDQERLLFVDDEEWLVDMWREILESLGYRLTATTSPNEALEIFRRRPSDFDLVILDQTMPQMTGLELARELLHLKPGLPIILVTGYSEQVTPEIARAAGIREFIMKPLSISELTNAINRALGKISSGKTRDGMAS